jgi:hypothetical protein
MRYKYLLLILAIGVVLSGVFLIPNFIFADDPKLTEDDFLSNGALLTDPLDVQPESVGKKMAPGERASQRNLGDE